MGFAGGVLDFDEVREEDEEREEEEDEGGYEVVCHICALVLRVSDIEMVLVDSGWLIKHLNRWRGVLPIRGDGPPEGEKWHSRPLSPGSDLLTVRSLLDLCGQGGVLWGLGFEVAILGQTQLLSR